MSDTAPTRRWFRWSLRTMFVVVTLLSGWMGIKLHRIREQARAVTMIQGLGGMVTFDYQMDGRGFHPNAVPPGPRWLRQILGDDYKAKVVEVQLFAGPSMAPQRLGDSEAKQLTAMSDVKWLVLMDTRITDAGLQRLSALSKLERIDLERTLVTAAGARNFHQSRPGVTITFGDGEGLP